MHLLDLPNEVFIKIFSYLGFDDIFNLMLVSSFFYNIFEYAVFRRSRPRMKTLFIENNSDHQPEGTYFFHIELYEPINPTSSKSTIKMHNVTPDVIDMILRNLTIDDLFFVSIQVKNEKNMFDIINKYFKSDMKIQNLVLNILEDCDCESFERLFQKFKNAQELIIYRLSFKSMKNDFKLPNFDELTDLLLNGKLADDFFEKRFIDHCIINSPKLMEMGIFCKPFHCYSPVIDLIAIRPWNFTMCDGSTHKIHYFKLKLLRDHTMSYIDRRNAMEFFCFCVRKHFNYAVLNINANVQGFQYCNTCHNEKHLFVSFL
uniref:F-box domain-containing protein n=1 Tax=Parastrongyloides trichosuri TaxID=131310 RepID=A0A0N4Z527_PARTI